MCLSLQSLNNWLDKILKLLGQGTFGKVVEAFDRTTKTRCAIKIIKAIPKYREASKMEIKVLQKISEADPDDELCVSLSLKAVLLSFLISNPRTQPLHSLVGLFQLSEPRLHSL